MIEKGGEKKLFGSSLVNFGWTALFGRLCADGLGWGIRARIWEVDIKQTARHDILFSWAMLTQIELPLLFSYASKVALGT